LLSKLASGRRRPEVTLVVAQEMGVGRRWTIADFACANWLANSGVAASAGLASNKRPNTWFIAKTRRPCRRRSWKKRRRG